MVKQLNVSAGNTSSSHTWAHNTEMSLLLAGQIKAFFLQHYRIHKPETTACLVLNKSSLYEASPLKLPFHINTSMLRLGKAVWAALSGRRLLRPTIKHVRMRDPLTFTPFTSFDSRTKGKKDGPLAPEPARRVPPPPSSSPWSLVSTHAWLWHQSAGSVGRFKLRTPPLHHWGAQFTPAWR